MNNSIANKGNYKKAIDDFEKALTINNHHSNAKKYLAETQAAYGKQSVLLSCVAMRMHTSNTD